MPVSQTHPPLNARVIALLAELTGLPDLHDHPDLPLFDEGLLDSMSVIRLLVAFSSDFGIELSAGDFDREKMATPRMISAFVESSTAP